MDLSKAKSRAVIFGKVGFVAGVAYSFGGALYDHFTIGLNSGTALAFLATIGMPILFASLGFLLGLFETRL